MLINPHAIYAALQAHSISIKGILHVGAHECEEKGTYNTVWNIADDKVLWLDANPELTEASKRRGIPNCYTAVLDENERMTTFKITNNGQSSSLLEFGSHKTSYPSIVVTKTLEVKTQTLEQFFTRNALDPNQYNLWNFDIQGSELAVFRGSKEYLNYADAIYTEVNTGEVYKECGLLKDLDVLLGEYGLQRVLTQMTDANWGDALYVRVSPRKEVVKPLPPPPPQPIQSEFGTITLAIPTYRRFNPFLKEYIPKYLNLPFVDSIVIADETGEDIDAIQKEPWGSNPKLRYIRNSERLGAYHNKLNLMRQCKTNWIALIDSDNEVCPEYFTALEKWWLTHGANSKEIYIPAHVESKNIQETKTNQPIAHFAGHRIDRQTWNAFMPLPWAGYCLNLGNCVFHKTAIPDIPETIPKDVMADCQVMNKALVEKGYTLVIVPNMKYYHIIHPGSLYLNTAAQQQEFQRVTDWTIR